MTEGEILLRIAETLRKQIGPAVDAEYPKTQAFMAGVVLQKLGQQLSLAAQHQRAAAADYDTLVFDLERQLATTTPPPAVAQAVGRLGAARDAAALCALVEALYHAREALGAASFDYLLGRVRQALRADIDRRMEVAA